MVASQTRTNIHRLTRTFVTLSLSDLASRVGLPGPAAVERELVAMIEVTQSCYIHKNTRISTRLAMTLLKRFFLQAGSIHAAISQQDGMVRFDTDPESYSSPGMLRLLESEVQAAIRLDRQVENVSAGHNTDDSLQVTRLEEDMLVSPAYVKKISGGRGGEEDEEAGSRYNVVQWGRGVMQYF